MFQIGVMLSLFSKYKTNISEATTQANGSTLKKYSMNLHGGRPGCNLQPL